MSTKVVEESGGISGGSKPIAYKPGPGLSYDPNEEVYWKADLLDQEVRRIFEICHGCRMCFKYCDSFPTLFDYIDKRHDGDVARLDQSEVGRVMDLCFQCKLCEVQCPYTPRDHHEFQVDFPKLVHRWRAVKVKEHGGIPMRDRVLGDPDATAKFARLTPRLANAMNRVSVHRWFMEKLLGIHRDKALPEFAAETFEAWAKKKDKLRAKPPAEVVLFQTCYVQNNAPDVGRDTLEVLEHNGVDVACVPGLKCCGMPAWEHGDLETLRSNAHHNIDLLTPWVEAGSKIAVINPTCGMMMRRDYPELVDVAHRERAEKLAKAVVDTGEMLWSIRNEPRFKTDFKSTPGATVAYHAPCHLRAQAVGFKGRDLLRKIPGVMPHTVVECCGHDGTFAMKVEGFDISKKVGEKAFDGMKGEAEAEVWATDCPLASLQFAQHAGKRPLHPMTILARAYRPDGFPTKLEPPPTKEEEEKKS